MKKVRPKMDFATYGKVAIAFLIISFLSGCGYPLYVGTVGSDTYHKPDCKFAEQSLNKYGKSKRVEYYSSLNSDLSSRKPCPKCLGK